jgi:tetratricopeptide (TPR) repeat protein
MSISFRFHAPRRETNTIHFKHNMSTTTSEGFDLDAVVDASKGDEEVVYEIGGGVSTIKLDSDKNDGPSSKHETNEKIVGNPLALSEQHKSSGNEYFLKGQFEEAYREYSLAIESTPGPYKGEDLLKQYDQFEREESRRMRQAVTQREEKERQRKQKIKADGSTNASSAPAEGDDEEDDDEDTQNLKRRVFRPDPPHAHATNLAIYYSNRSAVQLRRAAAAASSSTGANVSRDRPGNDDDGDDWYTSKKKKNHQLPPEAEKLYNSVVEDATIAVLFNPTYAKAYHRRCTAQEALGCTDKALDDAKMASQLAPQDASLRTLVARLQRVEDERLEHLKTETMGKLKELGNSILSNFGLSLDNFQAKQDPNTGSYSISFNQQSK